MDDEVLTIHQSWPGTTIDGEPGLVSGVLTVTRAAGAQLDHACDLAVAAYDIGCRYDSERVRQAVRDFRASLDPRAPQRITMDLDERLHSAYTTRMN